MHSSSKSIRSAGAPTARAPTNASTAPTGIPSGIWRSAAFEGGWTLEAAIPFKSLRYRPGRAQIWGFNARRINKWKNEISYLNRIPPAMGLGRGDFSASLYATVVGIDAPTGSKNLEVKPYAISELTSDLGGFAADHQRPRRRSRRRREIRHHPEPHRRLHLQHRLRAGGGRRAAGQPHPLQPAVSGEARVLSRERRDVRLRRRRRQPDGRQRRRPDPLLQPSHRPSAEPRDPDRRRRAHDRPDRPVQPRPPQHAGARGTGRAGSDRAAADAVDELLGHPGQARHPASQQHRRDRHEPLGDPESERLEPGLRARCRLRVLQQPVHQRVLGEDADGRAGRTRYELSRAARLHRRPLRRAGRPDGGRRQFQSRGGVRAPRQHAAEPRPVPIQSAASVDTVDSQVLVAGDCRLHRGWRRPRWRRATSTASSRSNSRTAIASASASRTTTSGWSAPFPIAPGVRIPIGEYDFVVGPHRLHLRPAAALVGKRVVRARWLLRRRADCRGVQSRAVST